jgi:hypothetical protein
MRGFRGSRAAQSLSSRFGRNNYRSFDTTNGISSPLQGSQSQRTPLPDWLKTPETKAQERIELKQLQSQVVARAPLKAAAPAKSTAPFRLVVSNKNPIVKKKVGVVAAKAKAPVAKIVAKSKAKPRTSKQIAAKRKAA